MTSLNTLRLISAKKKPLTNPTLQRRHKLARKLAEQIEVAKAHAEGRTYTASRTKLITNADGVRETVASARRVKEWFWAVEGGKVNLSVRYGSKLLELAKGKNAIELSQPSELVPTLQLIKDAVVAGELDDAIATASHKLREGFKK